MGVCGRVAVPNTSRGTKAAGTAPHACPYICNSSVADFMTGPIIGNLSRDSNGRLGPADCISYFPATNDGSIVFMPPLGCSPFDLVAQMLLAKSCRSAGLPQLGRYDVSVRGFGAGMNFGTKPLGERFGTKPASSFSVGNCTGALGSCSPYRVGSPEAASSKPFGTKGVGVGVDVPLSGTSISSPG